MEEKPRGASVGPGVGPWDVLMRPSCLLERGRAGDAVCGPRGSQVLSPVVVPGVSPTGRGQAVCDPCCAQKAPFLMQKMPVPGRGPREALRVGRSSAVLGSSRHRVHPLPPLGARLWGGCCLLSPRSARMLAQLAVSATLADPFVRGDSAYLCLL